MGIFGNSKSRGSIVGNYNTIKQTPTKPAPIKRSAVQDEFDTFGGVQYKGDLMGQLDDKVTTTTTVTKTEYVDPKTGKIMRTTTTTKKSSGSRAGSMVTSKNNTINAAKKPVDARAGSLTAKKPMSGRTNSLTAKKKYRYVSSSTGMKMVEITPEEELREKEEQEKMIRRSNSHLTSRPSSMYTQPKRQASTLTKNRQPSLTNEVGYSGRKNWAMMERASSGLVAAQVVTGNKDPRQLTGNDLKQRKSLMNMRSPAKKASGLGNDDIKEESPVEDGKPAWNPSTQKTIRRSPSMRNGLVINKTPSKTAAETIEPAKSLTKSTKKEYKITPMKVKVKPSLTNLKEKDENFLKFQQEAGKEDDEPLPTPSVKKDEVKPAATPEVKKEEVTLTPAPVVKKAVTEPTPVKKEEVKPVSVPAVKKEETKPTHAEKTVVEPVVAKPAPAYLEPPLSEKHSEQASVLSNATTEVPTLKAEDIVPQHNTLDEVTPENVPDVDVPVHREEDIVDALDEYSKENVTEIANTSFVYDQPPIIDLHKSEEQNKTPSKKAIGDPKHFESTDTVFYSANEDDFADEAVLEPIGNTEKPLKSAIRTKSKYSAPSEGLATKKKVAGDAFVKLTTAENTRLNSQLQDENQRKSRIVRSPSKRVSLKINGPGGYQPSALSKGSLREVPEAPAKANLKQGKMRMSDRMNGPTSMNTHRTRIKPNMNVQLQAPELTKLEKRSSFERERGEKTMGFGMKSMRHDLEAERQAPVYHHSTEQAPKFKSRFADSDDEDNFMPQPAPNKTSTRMMVDGKHGKAPRQEKPSGKPEEKKTLGTRLKRIFGSKSKK